jgi:hypothetical protein
LGLQKPPTTFTTFKTSNALLFLRGGIKKKEQEPNEKFVPNCFIINLLLGGTQTLLVS